MFAGLAPRLKSENRWLIAPFRPGARPFQALAATLSPLLAGAEDGQEVVRPAHELAAELSEGRVSLKDVAGRVAESNGKAPLLLIADQFEELYTLCHESATRQRFQDVLLNVDPELPARSTVGGLALSSRYAPTSWGKPSPIVRSPMSFRRSRCC